MENTEFGHYMVKPQELQIGHTLAILHTREYGFIALESASNTDNVIAAKVTAKGEYFGGYQWVTVSYWDAKFNKARTTELHLRRDLLLALKIDSNDKN